ncbi:3-alpha,7-alpha,12-alpha-trihydroxy-5-beta-cholest-24-enoyl-CoA hydratase [Streptosporangium violaceochromogenes]|nr:3-alpha,7-alpha,12-alpha-trihydroxy-5-beta-cholest-24-enoyl-CoA hydratase [Streptosporangium violaceochromogenes]
MPIDVRAALDAEPLRQRLRWTVRDVLLYHLSLGAGGHAATDPEPRYTLESELEVLPTFALVAGQGVSASTAPRFEDKLAGLSLDPRRILHAGQTLHVSRPIAATGEAFLTSAVTRIFDKGKAALVVLTENARDRSGEPLWTAETQLWVAGAGGFGGDPGPEVAWRRPDRVPDVEFSTRTLEQQALLYRLNGDMNPLHADAGFAAEAGFERPILHGLASFGMLARGVVDHVLNGETARLRGVSARFRHPVFPGQSLAARVWREDEGLRFEVSGPDAGDALVLGQGTAWIR